MSDGIFAAPIIIAPNDDTAVEGDETVALTITPNPDRYVTCWPDVASVTIHDDDWANMPPEAVDDEWEVTWNSRPELPHRFDGNVLGNDTDPDGDALYLATADSPGHAAEFEFHCDGSFTYVPEEDFVGDDTFMYIASDGRDTDVGTATIHIIDHEPIAIGDEYEVEAGAELVVAAPGVLGNDLDEDDDELTAELRTGPSHGALTEFHADGGFTYVPDPEFEGTDQFEYYAYDGYLQSVPAIVLLQVVADPMKSDIRVHELDYGGGTTLASDDLNGTTIIGWTRHWKDVDLDGTINPRTSSGEFERPYAYARNEELKLEKVTFKTRGGAAPQAGATIKVRGTVVLNGADVAKAEVTATAAGGVYVANNVVPDDINAPGVKYKFPAVVTAYDKLTIRWEISKDNGTTWKDGNSTANVVYVTWAPPQGDLQRKGPNNPIAIPVMETLVAYGTRGAANNAATAVAVRDGIWLRFIGSAATRNDGKPMYYYRNWLHTARQESYAFLIGGSIKGSERDGQCGNWAGLMYAAILANGIDGAAGAGQHEMVMLQVPNRIEGMLFGGWLYGQANNQPPYTHLNVTAAATPGYPFYPTMRTSSYVFRSSAVTFVGNNGGQNTPNSPSMFTNHVVVKDNSTGKFYDSSYGRLWTGLPDFQTNAVTGFTRSNLYRIARTVAC